MSGARMMKRRTNVRLDEQARVDAHAIMQEYGLGSVSAAIRFALREIAKRHAEPKMTHNIAQPDDLRTPEEGS